jgi:hypothetical protein
MTIKDDILAVAAEHPGMSASEIADGFGRDPRNTRRDIAELRGRGELIARKDEAGVDRYYFAGGGSAGFGIRSPGTQSPQVIDGEFEVVSPPPVTSPSPVSSIPSSFGGMPSSKGLALVPAGQPYDSRTAAALAQHERARRSQQGQGLALTSQAVASLNQAFADGYGGEDTEAMWQQAQINRLQAQTEHEQWLRAEYARRQAEERNKKEMEEKRRADEQLHASIQWALGAISGRNRVSVPEYNGTAARASEREPEPVSQCVDFDDEEYEKPRLSLAKEIRRAREERRLEAQWRNEELYRAAIERQKQRFPPEEWPWLYEDEPRSPSPRVNASRGFASGRANHIHKLLARKKPAAESAPSWFQAAFWNA